LQKKKVCPNFAKRKYLRGCSVYKKSSPEGDGSFSWGEKGGGIQRMYGIETSKGEFSGTAPFNRGKGTGTQKEEVKKWVRGYNLAPKKKHRQSASLSKKREKRGGRRPASNVG